MEIILSSTSSLPIYEQIVTQIKEMIMRGELKPEDPLPSMRKLAKDLQITTVAEGVETEENEHFLQEINCDYGQGYYYSRPIPAAEFEERFLKEKGA